MGNYKIKRSRVKPEPGTYPLPPGTWLPVSITAMIAGVSEQKVRLDWINYRCHAIKFDKGPLLINVEDILKNVEKEQK